MTRHSRINRAEDRADRRPLPPGVQDESFLEGLQAHPLGRAALAVWERIMVEHAREIEAARRSGHHTAEYKAIEIARRSEEGRAVLDVVDALDVEGGEIHVFPETREILLRATLQEVEND